MPIFYFTFGQKYRYEKHSQGGHPDGYFTIEANDEAHAREAMVKVCGVQWATSYRFRPNARLYPRGQIKMFFASEVLEEDKQSRSPDDTEQTPKVSDRANVLDSSNPGSIRDRNAR